MVVQEAIESMWFVVTASVWVGAVRECDSFYEMM